MKIFAAILTGLTLSAITGTAFANPNVTTTDYKNGNLSQMGDQNPPSTMDGNRTDNMNDSRSTSDRMPSTRVSQTDREFAMKAAQGGMAEVKMGQLALNRASNPEVKKFAKMMIDQHTKANKELEQIAKAQKITLPKTLTSADQATYNKLAKLRGTQFDRAYITAMEKAHIKDANLFQMQTERGENAQLVSFANKTLPIIQNHENMVASLASNNAVMMQQIR
ncbi:MAG: hypothetical protein N5P05_002265 [Chroococcopsis gigantea SAG 12.99]|jgi:putative membrane protein|nr:hypothetical protein [Chroococcopsis gigantea SAG 12.99]